MYGYLLFQLFCSHIAIQLFSFVISQFVDIKERGFCILYELLEIVEVGQNVVMFFPLALLIFVLFYHKTYCCIAMHGLGDFYCWIFCEKEFQNFSDGTDLPTHWLNSMKIGGSYICVFNRSQYPCNNYLPSPAPNSKHN